MDFIQSASGRESETSLGVTFKYFTVVSTNCTKFHFLLNDIYKIQIYELYLKYTDIKQ